MKKISLLLLTVCCMFLTLDASSQRARAASSGPAKTSMANPLEQLSSSLQSIASEVKPSVVRILNFAYAIEDGKAHSAALSFRSKEVRGRAS